MRALLEFLSLVVGLFRLALRSRADRVAENLLLRQELAVLTRPTQQHPCPRTRDKLFWVLVRAIWREWRRHLVLV